MQQVRGDTAVGCHVPALSEVLTAAGEFGARQWRHRPSSRKQGIVNFW